MVPVRALPVVALLLLVSVGTYATLTQGSSGGLSANGGEPQRGCTCHCSTQDSGVTPNIEGLAAEWEPAKAYALTVSFTGGATIKSPAPQNQGGFAMEVTHGAFATKDDKTQVKDLNGGKKFATHTAAGNDQASWDLTWTAPATGAGEITFSLATNNVNGDGTNGSGQCFDNWGKIQLKVPEKPAPPPADEEDEDPPESDPVGPPPAEGDELLDEDFEGNGTANDTGDEGDDDDDKGLLPGFEAAVAALALAGLGIALGRRPKSG